MATTTTNLGLRKPTTSDYMNVITDISENMEVIDEAIGALPSGKSVQEQINEQQSAISEKANPGAVASVSNGNTHGALSQNELVYVMNHDTLADGLYKATTSISANGTLSPSNVSALSKGIAGILSKAFIIESYSYEYSSLAVDSYLMISASDFGITSKAGYTLAGIIAYTTGSYNVYPYAIVPTMSGTVLSMRNRGTGAVSTQVSASVTCLWVKNELI